MGQRPVQGNNPENWGATSGQHQTNVESDRSPPHMRPALGGFEMGRVVVKTGMKWNGKPAPLLVQKAKPTHRRRGKDESHGVW